jgi:hypothetical protein
MRQGALIDGGLGVLLVLLGGATSVVSAIESSRYGEYLYGLGGAVAVVGLVQTARAVVTNRRHQQDIDELRAGQEYLAQPESTRMMGLLFDRHAALTAADERFREHFDIDSDDTTASTVICKLCGWQAQDVLADVWVAAREHLDAAHAPSRRAGLFEAVARAIRLLRSILKGERRAPPRSSSDS